MLNNNVHKSTACPAFKHINSCSDNIHVLLILCDLHSCYIHNNNNNNNTTMIFMVLSSWRSAIARVNPVHMMNADSAPGGRQPSDQANRLGL